MRTLCDRRLALVTLAASSVLYTGCGQSGNATVEAPREPPRNVRVMNVRITDLNEYLDVSGPVEPLQASDLSTEEPGIVHALPFEKGELVSDGDVVVLLDRDLIATEIRTAMADSALTSYNEDRTRNLYDANSVSAQEMLQAATALEKSLAHLKAARLRYDRAAIKAPYDGIVVDRLVEVGEYVMPGTPVARVVDPYTLKLKGAVTEREIGFIQKGAQVMVTLDGFPGSIEGVVHWIGFEADLRNGKFPIEINLDNTDLRLRPGVVGRGRVIKTVHRDVVVIPRDAVVQGRNGSMVYLASDTTAHSRSVELGADQGQLVIVSDGLGAGDRLIVRGQRDITDGDRIEVQEETNAIDGGMGTDPLAIRHPEVLNADPTGGGEDGTR